MAVRKLKPVEAGDGSYGGMVLEAYDRLSPLYTYEFVQAPGGVGPDAIPDAWHVVVRDGEGNQSPGGSWWLTEDEARTEGVRLAQRFADYIGARIDTA